MLENKQVLEKKLDKSNFIFQHSVCCCSILSFEGGQSEEEIACGIRAWLVRVVEDSNCLSLAL